jgi:FSR family fosmidomycin resistance protein-like MFS transporter
MRAQWRPLSILYTLVFIRSILQVTYAQFLPLYLTRERGFTLGEASWTLSAYLAAGAFGGFVGGNLADRFGGRVVILASMVLAPPALGLFFFPPNGATGMAGLILGGLALLFTIPVNVTMAQELAPEMGFSWGMAGLIFVPLTGWVGEQYSLHTALSALLVFPILGAMLTPRLKRYGCR